MPSVDLILFKLCLSFSNVESSWLNVDDSWWLWGTMRPFLRGWNFYYL